MAFIAVIIILLLLSLGVLSVRRGKKRREHSVNRYRHYHASTTAPKKTKMRRNRYHKASRREPDLGYQSPEVFNTTSEIKPEKEAVIIDSTEPENLDDPDVVLGLKEPELLSREKPIPNEAQITLKPPPPPPPIIAFHVMAEVDAPFTGYELLQAILSVNMRYGQHQIFHRHEEKTGHGSILFSLASVAKPGTFELSKMGGFSTPGLTLFFSAGDVEDSIAVYELMLQTAGQLVEDLGGNVLDENRQLLTPAVVVYQRRLLREYMEGQQVPDLFEETV